MAAWYYLYQGYYLIATEDGCSFWLDGFLGFKFGFWPFPGGNCAGD